MARKAITARHKEIEEDALDALVERVGPNARQLENEVEKLTLYVGARPEIELADVETICVRNKTARPLRWGTLWVTESASPAAAAG